VRRRLIYVIPAATAVLVAGILLGPGQERSVEVARLLSAGGDPSALRIVTVERYGGHEARRGMDGLELWVHGEARPRWAGATGANGVTEIQLERPLDPADRVEVRRRGEIIAAGALPRSEAAASVSNRAFASQAEGGGFTVRAMPERGAWVPPFAERVALQVTKDGAPWAGTAKVSALSAEPAESDVTIDATGGGSVELTAIAQPVMLSFEIPSADPRSAPVSLELSIPIHMSGMYVAAASEGPIILSSPGPRDVAFVSFWSATSRVGGAVVRLEKDERGFHRGALPDPPAETIAIVASGEANETGPSTTVWPRPGKLGLASAPVLAVAVDGTREAVARERRRVSFVRIGTVGVLCAAAAIELALLLWTGRRERRRIASLSRALAEGDLPEEEEAAPDARVEDAVAIARPASIHPRRADALAAPSQAAPLQEELRRARGGISVSQRLLLVTVCALVILAFAMTAALVLR